MKPHPFAGKVVPTARVSARTRHTLRIALHQMDHGMVVRSFKGGHASPFSYLRDRHWKPKPAKPPRERPKLKSFVRGSYPYNPEISADRLETMHEAAAEITMWIGVVSRRRLAAQLGLRNRLLRMARDVRRKIAKRGAA